MDIQAVITVIVTFIMALGLSWKLIKHMCPWLEKDIAIIKAIRVTAKLVEEYGKQHPATTVVDRLIETANAKPNKAFMLMGDQVWTYERINNFSSQVARAMHQEGMKINSTVAVMMTSRPEFIGIWFGVAKTGATTAFINHHLRGKSLIHCLEVSECKVFVTSNDRDIVKAVKEIDDFFKTKGIQVYVLGEVHKDDEPMNYKSLNTAMDQNSTDETPLKWKEDIKLNSHFAYMYTSGTTGLPKAAVVRYDRSWFASRLMNNIQLKQSDVIYIPLPLYHGSASLIGMLGALNTGCTAVIRPKFSASKFWDDCRLYNVTVVLYIGETMRYVCDQPERPNDKDHCVRAAIGNGLRPRVWEKFMSRFGKHIRIAEFYAATEGTASFFNTDNHIGSVGTCSPLMTALGSKFLVKYDQEKDELYRDVNGRCVKVPFGTPGLLISKITPKNDFHGYRGNKKQTEEKILRNVFKDGDRYFNSGDLLKRDRDYHIYFVDRVGDTFRWKGENVSTNEVADIMGEAPSIKEGTVYGVEVPGSEGRAGMMVVILEENRELDCVSVYQHACDYLAPYARPLFIRVRTEIDLTGTFKYKKARLVKEGFDPSQMNGDSVYFLDYKQGCYVPLTMEIFQDIQNNKLRV